MTGSGMDTNDPNHLYMFSKGSEVEVSSDEEGFKGAWFKAFVVENPVSSSASKKRKKVLVEYWSLVTEDGSKPLRENVDLGYLRPLPPDAGSQDFEVGDVVDADYRDGWWTGLVKKVLGNSKYRVFFENPPDVIEFEQKQMRVHQDWVAGKWVRPKKEQQQMTGSTFSPGTDVEVNFDNEDLSDAWIPAIVVKENTDNTFLVKYHNSKAKNWKDTVDFLHIRPPAPRYAGTYELREKVDAFCDFAWRAGEITKILPGKMYIVGFKRGMKSKELSQAEIRPLVEWKDGKWHVGSKEGLVSSNSYLHGELEHGPNNIRDVDMTSELESLAAADCNNEKKTPHPTNSGKNLIEQSTDRNGEQASSALTSSLLSVAGHVHSSKKLEDETPPGSSLSDKARTVRKKALDTLATSARGEIGTRRIRKPVVPFNMDSNVKRTKRHKGGGGDIKGTGGDVKGTGSGGKGRDGEVKVTNGAIKGTDAVMRKGRTKKLQVKRTPTSAVVKAGNASTGAAEKAVEKPGIIKEAEHSIRIASSTEEMQGSHESPRQVLNEELLKLPGDLKTNSNDPAEDNSTEFKQQPSGGSSNKRKRGRPRKLVVLGPEASVAAKSHKEAGHVEDLVMKACTTNEVASPVQGGEETADLQDASRGKSGADVSGTNCVTNEVGMVPVRPFNSTDDDDRPLSMWFGGTQCPPGVAEAKSLGKTVDQRNRDRERANIAKKTPAVHAFNGSVPEDNQRLPFVKSSPLWKAVESMEVFGRMPQHPHFRPLYKCKEECREGLAIGNMVTFAGLVDKISKLQFDDRGSIFYSTLESLLDLEKHGFNVAVLRSRVDELLSIKDRQDRFRDESKDAEKKITAHAGEKSKLAEEIDDISKKISELQEKHALIKSQMDIKDQEIAQLQQQVDTINQSINSARLDFEKLAAAPF
ncbi:Agenet domain containing protein [Trema orientale]|uniref:Agenet domain containing protein n=1 Tax=Trema orientale TaxID=63057 RepID=A0A2P5AZV9_TREOI|nr:Agenet domain containing protein [Trema orientale]